MNAEEDVANVIKRAPATAQMVEYHLQNMRETQHLCLLHVDMYVTCFTSRMS